MDLLYELDSSPLKPHTTCKVVGTSGGSILIRVAIMSDEKKLNTELSSISLAN